MPRRQVNRRHSARQCAGKGRFATHGEAMMKARQVARATGSCEDQMRAYLCPHCETYHWGHKPIGRRLQQR